jgi:hypothetical protein
MKKQLSFYAEPEQFNNLRRIAIELGYRHGAGPSVTGLVKAIADGELVICRPADEIPEPHVATNDSKIETIKASNPVDLARRHANIAHAALEAECPELAELHVRLAHAYALITSLPPA